MDIVVPFTIRLDIRKRSENSWQVIDTATILPLGGQLIF